MTEPGRELHPEKTTGAGPLALSLFIGGLLATGVFLSAQRWEQGVARDVFDALAGGAGEAVAERVERHVEALNAGDMIYRAGGGLERDVFADYASALLRRQQDRMQVLWLPRVSSDEREVFEQIARDEGLRGYRIIQPDGGADRRDEYFPVLYTAPQRDGEFPRGIDLSAEAPFRFSMATAAAAARAQASRRMPLTGGRQGGYGFLLFQPVYDKAPMGLTGQERRARLRGFIAVLVDAAALVEQALAESGASGIAVTVTDRDGANGDRVLYRRSASDPTRHAERTLGALLSIEGLSSQHVIEAAGREWSLTFTPGGIFLDSHIQWRAPAAAAAMFVVAVLVVWQLHAGVRRRRRIGELEAQLRSATTDQESAAAERARHDREERHSRVLAASLHQTLDPVILTDPEGVIRYVNPAFECVTGYTRAEAVGNRPNIVKSDYHDAQFYRRLWETILSGKSFREVFVNRKKDGTLYYEEKTITPLKDAMGQIVSFVSLGKEITQRMQDQERLQHLAYHDLLTALPNRALFMDRLTHAMLKRRKSGTRLAVLFLDTDEFKHINDTLGHAVGDRVLQLLGERISSCVREGDTVARIGGDEFAVLLEEVDSVDDVSVIAQKILDALGKPLRVDTEEFVVTISIGISLFPDDGEAADVLLKHADDAMYRAKQVGRASYQFYSAALERRALTRLTYESELHRAIEQEEFTIYYQPQVDLRSGRAVGIGVEALLRWQHPDSGLVSPEDFIPKLEAMEQPELITLIGEWVLRSACQQAASWRRAGVDPFRLSVNISGRQFHQLGLHRMVAAVLRETGFDPYNLELEITERALMRHDKVSRDNLQALQDLGVRLAIDDFGVGYSSLSSLKSLPVDTLKIDRSFVGDITDKRHDASIVSAIIAMGRNLGLEVVAEGVETRAQMDFLKDRGCYLMQGHLFSRPVPAAEISRLIA